MGKLVYLLLCAITLTIFSSNAYCQSSKSLRIVIIRHGEKEATGDNLNCKGLNRSLLLSKVIVSKFGVPAMIYVPAINPGKTTTHARMFQTATPLASKFNITINSKYDVEDFDKLSQNLEAQSGTVLVIWEHNAIVDLLKALDIKTKGMQWPDNDFDSIWVVTFNSGKAVLTTMKEGLNPAGNCNF